MKKWIYICLPFLLVSCMKLDSNLFNNDNKITEYKFDDYTGEQDFILDETYKITGDKIHLLDLLSQTDQESSPVNIKALYIGEISRIGTDTVILYCHGNKWHMDFYWQRAKLLAHTNGKHNYGVMMMDYRGYGLSSGKPSEDGMYADVDACMKWLKDHGLTDNRLIIYGFSLGSAPSCELTANVRSLKPAKLILEAPFGSSAIMVQDASQLNMPAEYFTSIKIDNAEEIKKVEQPFLWIHGTNDNFLNYKTHGQVVYDNYKGSYKASYMVAGADHGEVPEKIGFDVYLKTLGDFIRK
ncbi:MAG: alpha/beta hydrolase [Bacteroidia bacterium]|nr:alpha/beta hydrolase [Bacteroidia bacterium]